MDKDILGSVWERDDNEDENGESENIGDTVLSLSDD